MKNPLEDGFLRCGCLEVVSAVGFEGTGIHSFILAHGTSEELFRYSELLWNYIYADLKDRFNLEWSHHLAV